MSEAHDATLQKLIEVISGQTGHSIETLSPRSRLIADLGIDSLDMVELMMAVEEEFGISLPDPSEAGDNVYAQVFTKPDFCIADFTDLISMRQEIEKRKPGGAFWDATAATRSPSFSTFSQKGGIRDESKPLKPSQFIGKNPQGYDQFRRECDGIVQIGIPAAMVEFAEGNEYLDGFLIDVEPVSTTAFARFLNSVDPDPDTLARWITVGENQRRGIHQPLRQIDGKWIPVSGTETWPMILVSWYGANAYALWANGEAWNDYRGESPFLPSNQQFEYAARGATMQAFPWGERDPQPVDAVYAKLQFGKPYHLDEIPLAPVNAEMGVSPFGLRHAVGNVWQWCKDWLDAEQSVRIERGGSWIGPADLLCCDYRRGRIPSATGRCLGFRCVSPI